MSYLEVAGCLAEETNQSSGTQAQKIRIVAFARDRVPLRSRFEGYSEIQNLSNF